MTCRSAMLPGFWEGNKPLSEEVDGGLLGNVRLGKAAGCAPFGERKEEKKDEKKDEEKQDEEDEKTEKCPRSGASISPVFILTAPFPSDPLSLSQKKEGGQRGEQQTEADRARARTALVRPALPTPERVSHPAGRQHARQGESTAAPPDWSSAVVWQTQPDN
ncbi:hypothetical protein VTK73DRAFT_2661 [Phialemonium thermophilum]|uniref:Uncharacterized protein n=1 Tax=Phialemonium thermophilum TaxID=223376 RepID=A0ABR3VQI3_9PEZI